MKFESATLDASARMAASQENGHAGATFNPVSHVLLVDADAQSRSFLEHTLSEHYRVTAAPDADSARQAVARDKPDLILADAALFSKDPTFFDRLTEASGPTPLAPVIALLDEAPDPAESSAVSNSHPEGADDSIARPYSARELLARIGAHLAVARMRREAVERERLFRLEAETLNEVARKLSAETDLQTLLQKVTDAGVKLTGAKFGAFFYNTVDHRGESYVLYTLSGAPREAFERFGLPRNTPLFGATFRGEGVVRLDDVLRDPRYGQNSPHHGMPAGHPPVRSYLAVPVSPRSGEVAGGLFFGHPEVGVFTEHSESLVIGLAAQAAVALDNARLYGEVRKELEERKRVEAALRESEQRYRLVAEAANDYIWDWNLETGDVIRNDGPTRIFGYGPDQVRPDSSWGFENVHPDDREALRASMQAAIDGGQDYWRGEYRFRRADGKYADVLTRSHIVRDASGKPLRMISATMDMTERKRSGEALRESEQRFAMFMRHLPGLAWIKDADGRYVFVNDAAVRAFGKPKKELYGRTDSEVFAPETARQFSENDARALAGMAAVETVETLGQHDGVHHSLVSKFPIPGAKGAPPLIGGIAIDVTERIKAEQALRNSEERFRAVTMNAPVAIFIKDLQGRYTLANPLAAKALGRPHGIIGLSDFDVMPRDVAEKLRHRDLEVISSNSVVESEDRILAGGVERHYLAVKFPLHNAAGETVALGGVAVDVTERKQAQLALRESERRLLLATQTGKVGVWAWDIEANRVSWSESLQTILGMKAEDLALAVDSFESLVHPEDRQRVQQAVSAAVEQDVPMEIEFRALRPGGECIWLYSNASVIREGGRAVRMIGAALDITERKHGELQLRESEDRFRTLASHAPVGIFQSDLNGGTVYVNSTWCEMTGLTPEEARGNGWVSAIHPEDRDRVLANWSDAVARKDASAAEFRFQRPDGFITWLQGNAVPLRDGRGECIGYIGTVADITARKEAEAALRNSERMYRAIGESIDYGIWVCDAEGRNIYCSESFLNLVGLSQEEASNLGWCSVLHPDDVDQTIVAWKQCVTTGVSWDIEHRFRGVDGKWHPVLARGVPVRNDRGEIIAWVGINLDISELKEVEHELRESESRFRNMADNAPVLIWVHGVGGCQYVNREFMRFVGGTNADVQGMNWTQYLHPDDAEGYVASYQEAFRKHQPIDAQFRFRRADGEYRWLSAVGSPRFRPDGAFLGYVGCSVDITDIKASEAALREADRRKDDFLAMLGHELRNPLAGIVTGAQVLSMLSLESEAAEMQAVIARQATYMSRIVDDLLDVSRIARGKLRLRHQYANLRELLQDTVDDYRKSRALDQCEMRVNIPPKDIWIWADGARLAQAFSNIIHNSYKFSDGPNLITVEMEAADDGSQAVIRIADRGIGMTRETLDRIFEPFNQADNSLERSRGGLGLGLALTKGLIHLHGGTITAESEGLGHGAAFIITLPCVAPPLGKNADAPAASSTSERILIIDDRRDAILPLSRMLQMDGHVVATALDGPAGVAKAADFLPHVVLCDIGLPGEMNGYAVSRALRTMPQTASSYLVAVTGYGHEEARRLAKEAGFDYHLTKPLGKQQLRDLLSRRPTF